MSRFAVLLLLIGCTTAAGVVARSDSGIDNGDFALLLKRHVDRNGSIDYPGMVRDRRLLERYLRGLAQVRLRELAPSARLALLINAYNAFTLKLIIEHPGIRSIRDIPKARRWDHVRWRLSGRSVSLNELEHNWIRKRFREPRIHFALVCAARGCPRLRPEPYSGGSLERQLEEQTRATLRRDDSFRLDRRGRRLWLTPLFQWYRRDFEAHDGSLFAFIERHTSPEIARYIAAHRAGLQIGWLPYSWRLNGRSP